MFGAKLSRLVGRTEAHRGKFEELPTQQIAVDYKKGRKVDDRHEEQDERDYISKDNYKEKLQRAYDCRAKGHRPSRHICRIVALFHHLGDIIEKKSGYKSSHWRKQQ